MVLREYANGMYSSFAYYMAKSLADLPFNVVYPAIFGTITYWMVGLKDDFGAYVIFTVVIVLITNIAQSLGFLVSVALDLQKAITLFPVTAIPALLVGGLFLSVDSIPDYFIWLQYISFFFYAFMSLAINEFQDRDFHCSDGELTGGVCPVTTGKQVLENLGFDDYTIWEGIIGLLALYFIFRFLTYLALLLLLRTKSIN